MMFGMSGTWSGEGALTPSKVVLGLSTAATAEQWKLRRCLTVCNKPRKLQLISV